MKYDVLNSELSPEKDFISSRVICQFKMYAGAVKTEMCHCLQKHCAMQGTFKSTENGMRGTTHM